MALLASQIWLPLQLEPCAGRAAPPPPTICGRHRRRLLLIGAPPPPPIICRRAPDTIVSTSLFIGIFDDFFFMFSALWQVQTSNGFMGDSRCCASSLSLLYSSLIIQSSDFFLGLLHPRLQSILPSIISL